jgi:hypothetical protein
MKLARQVDGLPRNAVRVERDDALCALIARLMDTAFVIPGTKIRFGVDALIGLFPGIGDAIGALISSVLLAQAAQMGVPKIIIARMAGNVFLNTVIGSIPIFGDVFSVFYRSNVKNYALLQRHGLRIRPATAFDWLFVIVLVLVLLGLLAGLIAGLALLFRNV